MSLLQLGQVIRNVLICPLNKRFWQYGQKYQVDKFSVASIVFKNILLMISLLNTHCHLGQSFSEADWLVANLYFHP
tara:strand:- start:1161 stop:1388 length:228 start_codon:yes stop_codon:yes gene_type:complete